MIYISNLINEGLGKHLKKHWGKYALLGGGLATAALGKEIEGAGARKALKSFGGDDKETGIRIARTGSQMQKYGHIAAGAGGALGVKDQLDKEDNLDRLNKKKKKKG